MQEENPNAKQLYIKLQRIQNSIVAQKNSKNDFGGYNYRNVEDILTEVKPLLQKEKLTLKMSDNLIDKCGMIYVQSAVILVDQESGSEIASLAYAREPEKQGGMSASQITGSASSYARKYALGGMFLLSGEACPDYASQLDNSKQLSDSPKTVQDKDKDKNKDKNKDKLLEAIEKLGVEPLDVKDLGLDTEIPCSYYSGKKIKDLEVKEFNYLNKHREVIFPDHPVFCSVLEKYASEADKRSK